MPSIRPVGWTCYHEPNPKSCHDRDHDQPEGAAAGETGTRGDAFLDSSVCRWGESTFSSYGSMTATARNGERNIVIERATQRQDIRDVSDHQQHHPPTPRQPWTSTSTAAGFVEQSDGHAGAPHCAGNDGLLGRLVSDSGGVLGHGQCDAGAPDVDVDAGRWRRRRRWSLRGRRPSCRTGGRAPTAVYGSTWVQCPAALVP